MNIRDTFKELFYDENGHFIDVVSEDVIRKAKDSGLFKLFLPAALNGKNLSLSQTLNVFRETAYCSGSFGWLIQIGNGGNYFVTNCSDSTNQFFFSSADALLTGSAMTGGFAVPKEDGYLISGQWKFASGSEFATVFTATVQLENSSTVFTALVPRSKVEIIYDWQTLGMRQTYSNSFRVKDVFVPKEHIFQTSVRTNYLDHAIFNMPFFVYAQVFFSATLVGIIERLLEEGLALAKVKEGVWASYLPERLERVCELKEIALEWFKTYDLTLSDLLQRIEDKETLNEEEWSLKLKENAQLIKSWAHDWFSCFGMDVLQESHVINVFYRDLLTLTQHGLFQI